MTIQPLDMPLDNPTPAQLRQIREWLGLSQSEFSQALGFAASGEKTIRDWEAGERSGEPFAPTKAVWRSIRYMIVTASVYRCLPATEYLSRIAMLALPECLL